MKELILPYILGAFISSSWICTWFISDLPVHLFKGLRLIKEKDEVFTWEEWSEWLSTKTEFFAALLSCPLCFGFWTSLFVSSAIWYVNDLTPYFILSSAFSWPLFIYYFYHKLSK